MSELIIKTFVECLESSLPLSIKDSPEKYIELTDIIIPCNTLNYIMTVL